MNKLEALKAASTIDGWLTDGEMDALYEFGRKANGPIVEIGSCFGRSTACLALGSMAGTQQPVYAIDSFVGVPPDDRKTSQGENPGWGASSAEKLRANLDSVGVNGLVKIIAKSSEEAVDDVPKDVAVLFIDGDHSYEAVRRDICLFVPNVQIGGKVVMHDATTADPGVVKALDETLTPDAKRWQPLCRVDSAVVYERRHETDRKRIALAIPGSRLMYCAAAGVLTASRGVHDVAPINSGNGFDDMNTLWVKALNMARNKECSHVAMLHSDIHPSVGWIDTLASESDRLCADFISTVVALKDARGLTSSGVGDKDDHWAPFRRFTMREVHQMPETFGIEDTPHPDRYLLHNTGCWLADLRNPAWRTTDANGMLVATLSFPIAAQMTDSGEIVHRRESEDWYFSRKMAELGLRTYITRKVAATHYGDTPYVNNRPWGEYLFGDEATKEKWGAASA